MQETKTKHTKEMEVKAIGEPSITALSESEQQVFYTTLLKRITELATQGGIVCPYGDEEHEYKYVLADNFTCITYGEILGTVSPEIIEQMPKSN